MKDQKNLQRIQKYLIRAVSAALVVSAACAALAGCTGRKTAGGQIAAADFASVVSGAGETCSSGHAMDAEGLEFVAKSGLAELYLDPDTMTVAVKDTAKNKTWTALPSSGSHENGACAFSMSLAAGGKVYELNSQDNSVAFGTASSSVENGILTVRYVMALDQTAAARTADQLAEGDVWASFAVNYSLTYGSLIAEIDCASVTTAPGTSVLELHVLGSFGASDTAQAGDFMLVPDGSGAVIHTDSTQAMESPVSLRVYGSDPAISSVAENSAQMPIFGVKQGDAAFCTLIEQGEAVARIHAEKATAAGTLNRVWSSFILTDTSQPVGQGDGTTDVRVSGEQYTGKIRLCYRFLSDSNASYAGMAIAAREQLIRDGVIANYSIEGEETLPFVMTAVGSSDLGGSDQKLTTYSQAQDMVRQLKAKGADNIYLRYMGALSGGYAQEDPADASLRLSLGGSGDFEQLAAYMESQNLSLFLDFHMITAASGVSSIGRAAGADGGDLTVTLPNLLASAVGGAEYQIYALTAGKSDSALDAFLKRTEDYPIAGYSVYDAGSLLYSDYSGSYTDRQAFASLVSEQLTRTAYDRALMVSGGNLYTLRSADFITGIPLGCAYAESEAYESVPFLQMLLHGALDYSGDPMNLDDTQALLRSVEYGACPNYIWVYALPEETGEEGAAFLFESSVNDASRFYIEVNDALADLRGARMTGHEKVADGVYMTEYDSSSMVYVNYNEEDVTVDGVTIPAQDFIRIN